MSSDTYACLKRPISFQGSIHHATFAAIIDPPDEILYQAAAQVFSEE